MDVHEQRIWLYLSRQLHCTRFDIGKNNETFIPRKLFTILFWNKEDDEYDSIVQISKYYLKNESDSYQFSYGLYKYIESSQEIRISFDTENDNIYQLPHQLTRIRIGYPYDKKREKIWSYFIEKFDNKDARSIFAHNLCNLLNVEYLDDVYVIQDVSLTRKLLFIVHWKGWTNKLFNELV